MKQFSPSPPLFVKENSFGREMSSINPPQPKGDAAKLPHAPRILFVTPEISYLSKEMGPGAEFIRAKAGGMADVSASLVEQLREQGENIHLALPHYRHLFQADSNATAPQQGGDATRVHLAEDNAFYRQLSTYHGDLHGTALAFQREVINNIIPAVKPDIVHCNDWMTGLIPAACRKLGIKTVFTIHNIHREFTTLAEIEIRGIDTAPFWEQLYYQDYPYTFDHSYHHNRIDLLSTAILNADYVTTVSPCFLEEIMAGTHGNLPESIRADLFKKLEAGYAKGILNSPDHDLNPEDDRHLAHSYNATSHQNQKAFNKVVLQKKLGLTVDHKAPLLFWPSRLDPIQKGCQLLTDILFQIMDDYEQENLQLVLVADGPFDRHFKDIISRHGLENRVSITTFEESLSHLAFAAAEFVLMPSSFEPCGLPQMIGMRYGTLPIAHNTGGLHDTVKHFSQDYLTGNGFVFHNFDPNGLRWAIDRAIDFHRLPDDLKEVTVARVMREAGQRFNSASMFSQYLEAYRTLSEDRANQARTTTRSG